MTKHLLDDLFPAPVFPKPREVRQTWLKDPGFRLATWGEKMGLLELPDYLEVMGPRLDYVKLFPSDAINSPRDWFMRKVATYADYSVISYFDHAYFRMAWREGKVEQAIAAAAELGVRIIELTNLDGSISAQQWTEIVKFASSHDMRTVYELFPAWKRRIPRRDVAKCAQPSKSAEILDSAMPCLDAGAVALMIDHGEFELHGEQAG